MADYTASKMANKANSSLRRQIDIQNAKIAQKTKLGQDTTADVTRRNNMQAQSKKGFGTGTKLPGGGYTGAGRGMASRAAKKNAGLIGAVGGGQRKGTAGQLAAGQRMKGRTTYGGKVGPTKNKRLRGVPKA